MQILADKRLVQELPNGRTPEQRYKEQCKMKYVIVLMKECYTSLEYDREVDSRKIELKTLYQHWFVASKENLLVNPDHRVIARLNMGVHAHEVNGTAGNEEGNIHDPLMQARQAHVASAQTRETARQKVLKLETTLELAVQGANRSRNMAFEAAKREILATQLNEEKETVEDLSCLRREVANEEDKLITEDLDGEEAKTNEEVEAKANAEAKKEAEVKEEAEAKANAEAKKEAEVKEEAEAKANAEAKKEAEAKEKAEAEANAEARVRLEAKDIENDGCTPNGFLLKSMFIQCSYSDVIVLE
jgi:chemotaxis protein histidine kinase CheA